MRREPTLIIAVAAGGDPGAANEKGGRPMAERERELRVVEVEYVCDACGKGVLEFSHKEDRRYDCHNVHICSECNEVEYMDCNTKYPVRRFYYKDEDAGK
jgi:hypothetical protein